MNENGENGRPAVSVIVPVYNAEKHLQETVEALIGQTLFRKGDMEIVFSDDGSTDGSADICRRCAAAHPGNVRLVSGPNRGLSVSRNRGVDAASGRWIGFCDADDVPFPDHWEKLAADAERTGADMAFSSFVTIGPGGTGDTVRMFPFEGDEALLEGRREIARRYFLPLFAMRVGIWGNVWSGIVRRDFLLANGIRSVPRVFKGQDMLYTLDCLSHARRVFASGRAGYGYRQHAGSVSAQFARRFDPHVQAAVWYRLARERARIFRSWDRWHLHPVERFRNSLRVRIRLVRCLCASPFPAVRARVPRPVRAFVGRFFPAPPVPDVPLPPMKGTPCTVVTAADRTCAWGALMLVASMRKNGMGNPVVVGARGWDWKMRMRMRSLGGVRIADPGDGARCAPGDRSGIMALPEVGTGGACFADPDGLFVGECSCEPDGMHPEERFVRFVGDPKPWIMWNARSKRFREQAWAVADWLVERGIVLRRDLPLSLRREFWSLYRFIVPLAPWVRRSMGLRRGPANRR